jgi:hypothetical protein
MKPNQLVIVNLSGRGDKDVQQVSELLKRRAGELSTEQSVSGLAGSIRGNSSDHP